MTALAETIANQGAVLRHVLDLDLSAGGGEARAAPSGSGWSAPGRANTPRTSAPRCWRPPDSTPAPPRPPASSPRTAAIGGDALLVITHTTKTAFARRVREPTRSPPAPALVSITGEGKGWPEAIEAAPPERSETYTASYLAALLVLARLAVELGGVGPGTPTPRRAPRPGRSRRGRSRPGRGSAEPPHRPLRRRPGRGHRPRGSAEAARGVARPRRGLRVRVPAPRLRRPADRRRPG